MQTASLVEALLVIEPPNKVPQMKMQSAQLKF